MENSSTYFFTPLLILISFTSYIISISAAGEVARKTSTEFIRTSCTVTSYPNLCFTSLSSYASVIQPSPKFPAHAALSVTLNNTSSTSAVMSRLSQSHGFNHARLR
ncbi:hypothetical protein ACSBR1_008227 [Camellia fascicularis]